MIEKDENGNEFVHYFGKGMKNAVVIAAIALGIVVVMIVLSVAL